MNFYIVVLCTLFVGVALGLTLGVLAIRFIQRLGDDIPGEDYSYELPTAPHATNAEDAPTPVSTVEVPADHNRNLSAGA